MPDTEPAAKPELTYRVVAMPADTNAYGDIFGGWLMSQIDIAGSIVAIREAAGRVATVAIKEFRFLAPVAVGDLISCYAELRRTGRTSLTVHVVAESCRQMDAHAETVVADATLVYVALDSDGRPRPLRAAGT
ncbi:MAG: acyl-CoA thioesterase [Gammaproteobacteria bacterium]|nr:acyl-CoA thioesterase [Gammaproteobacteria bacterium]